MPSQSRSSPWDPRFCKPHRGSPLTVSEAYSPVKESLCSLLHSLPSPSPSLLLQWHWPPYQSSTLQAQSHHRTFALAVPAS